MLSQSRTGASTGRTAATCAPDWERSARVAALAMGPTVAPLCRWRC